MWQCMQAAAHLYSQICTICTAKLGGGVGAQQAHLPLFGVHSQARVVWCCSSALVAC